MLKSKFPIYIAILVSLSSCFKKEEAIQLPIGNSEIKTVFLGKEYEFDTYFDLGTNAYRQNIRSDWDLRFETSKDGWGIFINTESEIVVHKYNMYHLSEPKTFDSLAIMEMEDLIDKPNGKPEESAFKDWRTYKQGGGASQLHGIYVIEFKRRPLKEKFIRVQILNVSDTAYTCRFTPLYDAAGDSILYNNSNFIVKKESNQNYTYLTFKGGSPNLVPNVEPNKNDWDFVFTRYIEFFDLGSGVILPYPVNGVKSNKFNVLVARDSVSNFNDIDMTYISRYNFSTNEDAIGYDWKSHAYGAGGNYSVNSKIAYIIKDTEGYYYKMRFLDFYNDKAEKGYPKFEFVRIK